MPIDLTAPAADLGVQLIIEASTNAETRRRVATDPMVVAIAERAAELTADQRRRISDAYRTHFDTYRTTLTRLRHRVRHDGGPTELTVRAINERIWDLFACPAVGSCDPYHTCDTGSFPSAVQDAIFAHLARRYVTGDEVRLLTAPWIDVAGQVRP